MAKFVNPYNFVQIDPKKNISRSDVSQQSIEGLVSGVLECSLYTKTPLAIPDSSCKRRDTHVKDHYVYPFMKVNRQYIIPGSSLRGSIRSMYETLTDSCFVSARSEDIITYRTKNPFKPGLIQKNNAGKWELFEAKRYKITKDKIKTCYYGQSVKFSPDGNTSGSVTGYICIGEYFSKKKYESIFVNSNKKIADPNKTLERAVNSLNEIIRLYNDEKVNRQKGKTTWYKGRNYSVQDIKGPLPVWYTKDAATNNIRLAVAAIGRSAYWRKMTDLLGSKEPCRNRSSLCKACRLFGMIAKNDGQKDNSGSLGSHIRVTDAVIKTPGNVFEATLRELSSSKISYLPFYLKVPSGSWDYDNPLAVIRGRKFYWHDPDAQAFLCPEKNNRNATMELMPKGVQFSFKIYFDRISNEQLEELKWTLTLGENDKDGKQCYKIGHGKPIGLGSVKIVIDSQTIRQFQNDSYEYKNSANVTISQDVKTNFSPTILKDVLKITNLDAVKNKLVHYPGVSGDDGKPIEPWPQEIDKNKYAAHQWFGNNFALGQSPQKTLPAISDADPSLEFYKKAEIDAKQARRKNNKDYRRR